MPQLILTHQGSMELGGVGPEADWNEIELSGAGQSEALALSMYLANEAEINAIFTSQSVAAKQTAEHIKNFQPRLVGSAALRVLNETSGGKIEVNGIRRSAAQTDDFRNIYLKPRLLQKENVLIVAGPCAVRAMIKEVEGLTSVWAAKMNIEPCETRIYETTPLGKAILPAFIKRVSDIR